MTKQSTRFKIMLAAGFLFGLAATLLFGALVAALTGDWGNILPRVGFGCGCLALGFVTSRVLG